MEARKASAALFHGPVPSGCMHISSFPVSPGRRTILRFTNTNTNAFAFAFAVSCALGMHILLAWGVPSLERLLSRLDLHRALLALRLAAFSGACVTASYFPAYFSLLLPRETKSRFTVLHFCLDGELKFEYSWTRKASGLVLFWVRRNLGLFCVAFFFLFSFLGKWVSRVEET